MKIACAGWAIVAAALSVPTVVWAQSPSQPITLIVAAGRPLDVLLDQRIVIKRVGQPLTGIVVQPLYAYDRVRG